jgi:hypothetical protein
MLRLATTAEERTFRISVIQLRSCGMTCEGLSHCAGYGDSNNSLGTFSIDVDTVYGASVLFLSA